MCVWYGSPEKCVNVFPSLSLQHIAFCYWYILPKSIMFLISSLLNSSSFQILMLLRSYFPTFLHFPGGWSHVKCFRWRFYKFIPRGWSQAVSSWHKTVLVLPSWFHPFYFLLTSVQGLSVTFAINLCSSSFYCIFLSRKSLLKRVYIQVWIRMYLVYVF